MNWRSENEEERWPMADLYAQRNVLHLGRKCSINYHDFCGNQFEWICWTFAEPNIEILSICFGGRSARAVNLFARPTTNYRCRNENGCKMFERAAECRDLQPKHNAMQLQIDSSLARSSWEFTAAILIYRFLIPQSARRTRASKLFYSCLGYVCVAECIASIKIRLAKHLATWQLCAKRKSGVCFGFFLVFWLKLVFISFYQFCYRFALINWID